MPQEVVIVVHLLNLGDLDRMHKLNLDNYKENKLELSEVELLLLMEMGFFSDLKRMKIRFNPKPFANPLHQKQKTPIMKKEKLVDLHLEIAKKVDGLIARNEKEIKTGELEPVTKIQAEPSISDVVVIREPSLQKPEMPTVQTELQPPGVIGELDQREEFFEIEQPAQVTPEIEQVKEEDITSWMVGDEDKKAQRSFWGLSHIKVRGKEKESAKINGVSKTKQELEKTKEEIETKKRALEEAMQKEKEKELELKGIEEEKRKQEKLKKLEQKKKQKEEKQKEKETKKAEKEKKSEKQEGKKPEAKEKKVGLFKKDKETESKPMDTILEERESEVSVWDDDIKKLLPIIDRLFDKLPDDVVDEFAQSEDFELYERVMLKYKSK